MKLPQSEYFDRQISIWSHSLNSSEPWNGTLGEFLSGDLFTQRNFRLKVKDLQFLFKPNPHNGNKPTIDPKFYNGIVKLMDGKFVNEIVKSFRDYIAVNGKDDLIQSAKKLLPGATISASFDKRRSSKQPHTVNNLLTLDIDGVDVKSTMAKLQALNICLWISQSVTGTGVYAIVPLATDNLTGHFEAINLLMQEHGISLDPLKDVTRLRYWSIPDDAIINIDAKPFEGIYSLPEEIKIYRGSKEKPVLPLGSTSDFDKDEYAKACHEKGLRNAAANLKIEPGEIGQHLHLFIKYYHWAFNHFGIGLQFAVDWTWRNFFTNHEYFIQKKHGRERIMQDFQRFYQTYRNQHHIFDFKHQRKASIGEENYDLTLSLPYGSKLSSIEVPLITDSWLIKDRVKGNCNGWNKYLLDSPTNSGKTSTFVRHFLEKKIKGLIVVPTQGALEQLKKDYPAISTFYEKNKEVAFDNTVICTTYASFEKLCKTISVYDRFLVVDEFHNVVLSTSKDYRNRELNLILDRLDWFQLVVLMTGTNLKCHHPVIQSFKKVKVTYENEPVKTLHLVYHSSKNQMNAILSKISLYNGLQVIYLDNKDESGGLGELLAALEQNGFKSEEILLANADRKSDESFQHLIWNGRVSTQTRIIIATKIFVEALNLYEKVEAFHILSSIHGAYMQQLVARPRNNGNTEVYLYWHEKSSINQDFLFWFDQERYYQRQINLARNLMVAFEDTEWDDIHRSAFQGTDVIRKKTVKKYVEYFGLHEPKAMELTHILDYDYLNCDFLTQEKQVQLYKRNPDQLFEYLNQYNWRKGAVETSKCSSDRIDTSLLDKKKADHAQAVKQFIDELIKDGANENKLILDRKVYENISWQIELRKQYAKLSTVLDDQNCNTLFRKIEGNKRSFKKLMAQIRIRQALIFEGPHFRQVTEKIFDQFPIGQTFSSEDILKKIQQIQNSSFSTKGSPLVRTATAASQLLNLFVETKRSKMKDLTKQPPVGRKTALKNGIKILSHHPIRTDNGEPIEPIIDRAESMKPLTNEERLYLYRKYLAKHVPMLAGIFDSVEPPTDTLSKEVQAF